jgi:hypothetical protein
MYTAMEQLPNGEFTGFMLEAETKENITEQLINLVSEKTFWFITDLETKNEYFFNKNSENLEQI